MRNILGFDVLPQYTGMLQWPPPSANLLSGANIEYDHRFENPGESSEQAETSQPELPHTFNSSGPDKMLFRYEKQLYQQLMCCLLQSSAVFGDCRLSSLSSVPRTVQQRRFLLSFVILVAGGTSETAGDLASEKKSPPNFVTDIGTLKGVIMKVLPVVSKNAQSNPVLSHGMPLDEVPPFMIH